MGVVALFIMSGVFIYARFIEPKRLFIERTTIYLNQETQQDQTPEIKIALFGDVHRGVYKNSLSLESIVKRVNAENPDMVIIPGDFVYELPKENIGSALSGLRGIQAPVFAVTGNHDVGFPGEDVGAEVTSALEAINIKVIDNKIEKVTLKGKEITLVGLSDLWQGRAEYSLLEKVKPEDFVVVVTHNPDTTFKLSSPEKADLLLAGHTHGGQIRLPLLFRHAIPTHYDFDKGLHEANSLKVFVTPGIGMVGLPFRFLIPPQMDIITLNFQKSIKNFSHIVEPKQK